MDAVGLDGARDADQVFVDHGHDGQMVFGSEVQEDLIELVDVVGTVVGWQSDAGEKDADVGVVEGGEDGIEVAAGLVERKSAETVVAAELDNDHRWMGGDDGADTDQRIFCGGAAGAHVGDLVVVAELVEIALKGIGVGLARVEA